MSKKNTFGTYFKIIGDGFPFMGLVGHYHEKYSQNLIPCGITVSAKGTTKGTLCIQSQTPVIHFSDSAFDTMLWLSIFGTTNYAIYEITPVTPVIKQKCTDSNAIYQCGAESIRIEKIVPMNKMFNMALSEYCKNRKEKHKMYPHLKFKSIIASWIQHESPTNIY